MLIELFASYKAALRGEVKLWVAFWILFIGVQIVIFFGLSKIFGLDGYIAVVSGTLFSLFGTYLVFRCRKNYEISITQWGWVAFLACASVLISGSATILNLITGKNLSILYQASFAVYVSLMVYIVICECIILFKYFRSRKVKTV